LRLFFILSGRTRTGSKRDQQLTLRGRASLKANYFALSENRDKPSRTTTRRGSPAPGRNKLVTAMVANLFFDHIYIFNANHYNRHSALTPRSYKEITMETNREAGKEAMDQSWFNRFEKLGAFQAYEYLDGDKTAREEQKRKFLAGDIQNPSLDYPKLKTEELVAKNRELLELKADLIKNETNETVRQLYRWRINEKLAEVRLLLAVTTGDTRRFKRYVEFVYGAPSKEIFAYTVNELRSSAEQAKSHESASVRRAAESLLSYLPALPESLASAKLPSDTELAAAKTQTLREMSDLIKVPEIKEQYTSSEIQTVFESAIAATGANDWKVVVETSSKTAISVDQEKKQVKVPETRKVALAKLQTLIAHEIGTHVARRMNGEHSRLMLLGLGLDRYERGEEGIATFREQAVSGEMDEFAGLEGHLAIGLAYGLDGKPRDFRETYEILKAHYLLKNAFKDKSPEKTEEKSSTEAWNRAVRTFRGTAPGARGVCFTKDIIYREGNIGVWDVVKANPAEMMRFSIGKYDPTNPRHLWILDTLSITDQDLAE